MGCYESTIGSEPHKTLIQVPGEFSTIQSAIDTARNGDTVLVENGNYYENLIISKKQITLGSLFIMDGDENHILNTIVDGGGNGSVLILDSVYTTTVITGFTFQNGNAYNSLHSLYIRTAG